ncbi:MAG: AI-2E family transporter [Bacillota bacterium]
MEETHSRLKTTALVFLIILGIAVTFVILKVLQDIFVPLVVAYFLFFIFMPLNSYLRKIKFPVWTAIIIDLLIMMLVMGIVSWFIIAEFGSFWDKLPEYENRINKTISGAAISFGIRDPSLRNFQLRELSQQIDFGTIAGNAFASTFSFLGNFLIMFILFAFIVPGHPIIYNALEKRFADKKTFSDTFQEISVQVRKYFSSKVIISVITAFAEGLTVYLFGVDFAVVWGVLIFFLNFIPGIGSLIALSLPCLLALAIFDSLLKVIIMVIVLVIMDTILGNIIEPLMFGDRMEMNPLIIILSLLIWGYVWGVLGALLSVPIMAIFKIIISRSRSVNLILINDLMDKKKPQIRP